MDTGSNYTASDALDWMRELSTSGEPMLFRGQTDVYPTILPSLLRPEVSQEDRSKWWAVTRRLISSSSSLTGYKIRSPHDVLAITQHYLQKSPVIDMTATPEIALSFALGTQSKGGDRVVYAIASETVKDQGLAVSDHDFLARPMADGGKAHRWLRQDGFTIGTAQWEDLAQARNLDLLLIPGLKSFHFTKHDGEESIVKDLGDLEAIEGDDLAVKVRGVFENLARSMGHLDAVRRLLPQSGTIDGHAKLLNEIGQLIERAQSLKRPKSEIEELESLRNAAYGSHWDTAWDASLDFWKQQISNHSQNLRDV
jgi:hypothetical protein